MIYTNTPTQTNPISNKKSTTAKKYWIITAFNETLLIKM